MQESARSRASVTDFVADLTSEGRGWILLFVSVGWFLTLGIRIVYPTLLPDIRTEFGFDYSTAGLLISVLWTAYALIQFPSGLIADYIGERSVLFVSIVLTSLSAVAILFSSTLPLFILATVALGVGTGFFGTTRVTVLSSTYSNLDTTAISLSQSVGNLGNILLPVSAGFVSVYLGWRWGFGFLLPVLILTAVGLWIFVPRRVASQSTDGPFGRTLRQALTAIKDTNVLHATSILLLNMLIYQGVTGFLPSYLVQMKEFSSATAAILFGLFFATAIVVQFISGVMSDRYGRQYAMAFFLGASAPAFVFLTFSSGLVATVGLIALMSSMVGAFPPAHAYVVRALPSDIQGSGYGLLRTCYIALGALGPFTIGLLADAGLFDEAFLLLGGVALLTSVISLSLPTLE